MQQAPMSRCHPWQWVPQADISPQPGSTICSPVFGGEMEVAACSFPECKQIEGRTGPSRTRQRPWFYALWSICPWSATRMPNLSPTATLRICATPDSKHVKETHLDQTVLVSARGTNRKTIQPSCQLEESAKTRQKNPTTEGKFCIWNVLLDRHAIPQVADWGRVSQTELSNFQLAIWNDWVLSRSDTSLAPGAFWHKDTCLVLVWQGAELAKLCKMLRSASKKDFKTVVAI